MMVISSNMGAHGQGGNTTMTQGLSIHLICRIDGRAVRNSSHRRRITDSDLFWAGKGIRAKSGSKGPKRTNHDDRVGG
ncbi:MAG TPA: hypothetical protein DCR97_04025 [Deltaproteobacteria bacterium]|nr:hypothetical protein [Deltaproteobacteria bacterium]